jgi:hypothetical protein
MNTVKKISTSLIGSNNKPIGADVFFKDDKNLSGQMFFLRMIKNQKELLFSHMDSKGLKIGVTLMKWQVSSRKMTLFL